MTGVVGGGGHTVGRRGGGGAWKATHWEAGNEHQRELREEQKFRDRRIPCEP
jgi:hypothetical protein